jgi:GNAT superfamily N-acetyltransferase
MNPQQITSLKIRRARSTDAARLAELTTQLGYPTTAAEVSQMLRKMKKGWQNALFVAESRENGLIGWTHVSIAHLLEVGTRAEINGLIVADGHRGLGAGVVLLDAAEAWARKHGAHEMSVRSKVERERAHHFYVRQGYEHYKTQKAFRKPLWPL